ncbi:hypothetical protein HID58_054065 [Brassica napus]|uniref:Uncharacterized protein n=1 Tax=Brassica napus TaxID=3708 RepID=A0ABQ8AHQ9_BRANA|nr:hypothetical protein HID58_054065 [Brassica napus]
MGSSACTYSTVHAFTITRMGYTTRTLSNTAIAGTLSVSPSHALPFPQLRLTAAGCTGAAQGGTRDLISSPTSTFIIIISSPTRPLHSSSRNRNPRALAPFLVVHFDFHNLDSSKLYASGISTWAKSFKLSQPFSDVNDTEKSAFAKGTSSSQPGFIGTITKGLVDTSKNAIKAVQVNKARHAVSFVVVFRGFDLDLTYITENIIAMGFPAGYLANECVLNLNQCYRNQMEEVIDFLETRHKGKYKAYNLCSERLYDVSLFEGKVFSHFDDHNCPPIHLITSFCQSAYSWLKEDIENVVAVHCKAGMARTGLMICSLFLYLKFFPTAEEYMDFYNQKRCVDGNGLVLPSQITQLARLPLPKPQNPNRAQMAPLVWLEKVSISGNKGSSHHSWCTEARLKQERTLLGLGSTRQAQRVVSSRLWRLMHLCSRLEMKTTTKATKE